MLTVCSIMAAIADAIAAFRQRSQKGSMDKTSSRYPGNYKAGIDSGGGKHFRGANQGQCQEHKPGCRDGTNPASLQDNQQADQQHGNHCGIHGNAIRIDRSQKINQFHDAEFK